MLDKPTDLAAAISSRICHDLISPIGAISNGLELLELSGTPQSPELALIAQSVANANAKVRYLRVAFGDATSNSSVTYSEITDILDSYYCDPRTRLHWGIKTSVPRDRVKLLFLLLLCIEKIAPYGCTINVTQSGDSLGIIVLADNLITDEFIDFSSQQFCPQNAPALVQFNLVQTQINFLGYHLNLAHEDTELGITLGLNP